MAKKPSKNNKSNESKPRLKHPLVNIKKHGTTGLTAPDPKPGSASAEKKCLGFVPSLVSDRCRCEVCRMKPLSERTKLPFVSAPSAGPSTTTTPLTSTSVPSSPPEKEPPPNPNPTTPTVDDRLSYEIEEDEQRSDPTTAKLTESQDIIATPVTPALAPIAGRMIGSVFGNMSGQALSSDTAPHLVIEARAGTGKTTTLVEGLKLMMGFGTHLTPSPQQKVVWDAICQSAGKAKTVCFVAFNKSIAAELKRRVPPGVDAMTMHGMGFRAVSSNLRLWGGDRSVSEFRVSNIIEELTRTDIQTLRRTKGLFIVAVTELVGLCKVNLLGFDPNGTEAGRPKFDAASITDEQFDQLVEHFDIDLDGTTRAEVYSMVVRVLDRCLDVAKDRCIDYNDMIWIPVVLGLPIKKYDMLLVDEAQDLNRCQQALAKMCGERLILCGDPKQAIYGFAGADCESMNRMGEELGETERKCVLLPLTVTRRCGKAIVTEANKIVQDFSAHESNPDGMIVRAVMDEKSVDDYRKIVHDGNMVLCRCNGPLVSECFRFIKAGRKANIQGRDIGKGLVKQIEKMKAVTVGDLIVALELWAQHETEKELRKKFPNDAKIIGINDKLDCLMAFTEGVATNASPALVVDKINSVFTDDKNAPGIRLSSIHKAKGLEAKRVFLLEPEGATVPHPMAKMPWAVEQEWNLRYVAITRAIEELVYVS